ncbi:MAG: SO_0444 family Cu/Zn efflux transporter [bacterium]|nr:SO_0444 family Cu/Zn efflux transporter [bacterium]
MTSETLSQLTLNIWQALLDSSTWLLFGFAIAAALKIILPSSLIEKQLSKPGWTSVIKASAFGLPLPLCSCSVVPVGAALRRGGASRGATASFFVSTPEIGVDSFLLSFGILGKTITLMRVLAAALSAVTVGLVIDYLLPETSNEPDSEVTGKSEQMQRQSTKCGCHANRTETNENNKKVEEPSCCRTATNGKNGRRKMLFPLYLNELKMLLDDLALPLTIGFIGAGLISTFVPDTLIPSLNLSEFSYMLVMLVVGIPMYVCSVSSTPIAAAMIAKGVSPGAALVFLLAGPATNLGTVTIIGGYLGRGALAVYILGISLISLACGFFLNIILPTTVQFQHTVAHLHHKQDSLITVLSALLLASAIAYCLGARITHMFNRKVNGVSSHGK